MNDFLVAVLVLVVLWLLAWGMMRRGRIYEFPFHIGAVTFAFILLQVPGLSNDQFLPEGAFAKTIIFLILCLLMCLFGWTRKVQPLAFLQGDFDERRLLVVAALLSLLGAYFYFSLSRLPGEVTIAVQMTGVPVIYVFFSRLLVYGLTISTLCLVRRFSLASLLIVTFDMIFYLDRLVIGGKRADSAELIIIFALAIWFYRRRAIPRLLVLCGIIAGTLIMNSVGDYRTITKENSGPVLQDISQIDVMGNAQALLEGGGAELRNAILRVSYTDSTKEFDLGMTHWNFVVFSFVPAQLLGTDFKDRLMVQLPSLAKDYNPILGTTETGLADAFQSFWYFGALKFFLLAYIMRRLLVTAQAGEFAAQFVYILSVTPAMHSISHRTDWVLMIWIHLLLFAAPVLTIAVISQRSSRSRRNSAAPSIATDARTQLEA